MKTIKGRDYSYNEAGFTLIELSIVLVIIGLIVGAVLAGREMIKAAEIRSTISQLQKYTTAVNTFRTRYNYVPGDMPAAVASQFGFFNETTLGGTAGHEDGNGLVEGGATGVTLGIGETLGFWRHLTDAGLVDGVFGTATAGNALVNTSGQATSDATAGTVGQLFPPAKMGGGNYVTVYSAAGQNYFELTGMTAMAHATGQYTLTAPISPVDAQTIDTKMDDGLPLNGAVQAMNSTGAAATLGVLATNGAGNCINNSLYNAGGATANSGLCQVSARIN